MGWSDQLLVDSGLLQQAERVCTNRLALEPENRVTLRSLAELFRKQGKLDEAGEVYGRLFRLDPEDREAGYTAAIMTGGQWSAPPPGIRPAPFVLVRNFLPAELHDTLLPFFVSMEKQFVPLKHMGQDNTYRPDMRQTLDYPGSWAGRKSFTDRLVQVLSSQFPLLYLPPFEVRGYEIQVRAYQDGHFFKIHRDADPDFPGADRIINFVYYFHKVPRPYTGGELLLFDSDTEIKARMTQSRFTRIVPEDNCLVAFPAHFYHSVVPIRCPSQAFSDSRFVINGHVHKQASQRPVTSAARSRP